MSGKVDKGKACEKNIHEEAMVCKGGYMDVGEHEARIAGDPKFTQNEKSRKVTDGVERRE